MPRGFTLLELLITVAVLSIILAFAAPSFQNCLEDEAHCLKTWRVTVDDNQVCYLAKE